MRRVFIVGTVVVAMTVFGAGVACSQTYPNRPIRIVTAEAGTAVDIAARLVAQEIAGSLGQPMVIENRGQAVIGELAANATPDGYTIAIGAGGIWLTPLTQKTRYDPVKDFAPVTMMTTYPLVLIVSPSVPVKSVTELIDLAKAKPGSLNYAGSVEPGAGTFLSGELFRSMARVNVVPIPYKGAASAMIAVMSGESQFMFIAPAPAMPNVKSGKLKALAVTSLEPTPLAPGLPTVAAGGLPGYEWITITGVLAPARTPVQTIARLNREIVRVLNSVSVQEKLFSVGVDSAVSSPSQFAVKIKSEIAKWRNVMQDAGIKVL